MSTDPANVQQSELHRALHAAALEAYGSLLAPHLAEAAAASFAEEASQMLDAMLSDHTQSLRERIENQLSGMSLAKSGKRKAVKAPAANGATKAPVAAEPTAPAESGEPTRANGVEAKAPAKPAETKSKAGRPRKKPSGRSSARG